LLLVVGVVGYSFLVSPGVECEVVRTEAQPVLPLNPVRRRIGREGSDCDSTDVMTQNCYCRGVGYQERSDAEVMADLEIKKIVI